MRTLRDLIENIDKLDDRDILSNVTKGLTTVSNKTLLNFQQGWDGSRPYDEFVAAQNKVLVECIQIEVSEVGTMVREAQGLEPITLDTQLHEFGI